MIFGCYLAELTIFLGITPFYICSVIRSLFRQFNCLNHSCMWVCMYYLLQHENTPNLAYIILFMDFIWFWTLTTNIFPSNIDRLLFIMEAQGVLFEEGPEFVNFIWINFLFKNVSDVFALEVKSICRRVR